MTLSTAKAGVVSVTPLSRRRYLNDNVISRICIRSLGYAALPAAIPLDDGSLEGYALEPGYVECDVVGGRGEVAVIAAAAVALTGLAALVAGRLRLGLRLLYSVSNLRKLLYLI